MTAYFAVTDTIAAIATPAGRGGIGVIRISGERVAHIAREMLGDLPPPRQAALRIFQDAEGAMLDGGLAIYFPAPASFTAEDVLELHAHGSPVVLDMLLARILQLGARLAAPGEFSRRAFLNDKIDLAQAEAIADLIDSSSTQAARAALRSLQGEFSMAVNSLADAVTETRMHVEAALDFPEEEIDFLRQADAQGQLQRLCATLARVSQRARQGALLREGIKVVIAGQPNAGKSSLLNALAGAELAIVTPVPGTTRDVVSQTIQIEGVPLHVIDTAGLRESEDQVERIGIARAWDQIAGADAVLFLHDLTRAGDAGYQAGDAAIARGLAQKVPDSVPVIDVWNKLDAVDARAAGPGAPGHEHVSLSARTGAGLDALRRKLLDVAGWQSAPEGVYIARERHVQALRRVDAHLREASALLAAQAQSLELLAEELRLAQNALNEITGEFTPDDLLGVIFASFCIGK